MKRFLFVILLVSVLSPAALAQSDPFLGGNFSVRIPIESGDLTLIALGAQGGDYHLLGPLGLRGRLGLGVSPSVHFDMAADLIIPFIEGPLGFYGGVGGSLIAGGTLFTALGIHGLVGLEGRLRNSEIGLFGEVQPNLSFPKGNLFFSLKLNFGVNYHF